MQLVSSGQARQGSPRDGRQPGQTRVRSPGSYTGHRAGFPLRVRIRTAAEGTAEGSDGQPHRRPKKTTAGSAGIRPSS